MISLKTQNWEIENIETVLFDKDGTFIDLHHFWGKMTELRCAEIIKSYNLPATMLGDLCTFLGYDFQNKKMLADGITALYSRQIIIEIFTEKLKKINIKTTTEEITQIFDNVNRIFYQNMFEYTKPILPAIDFIKKLYSNNIKLGIVTSDSIESTQLTLKHFGWEYLFSAIAGRESSDRTKESGALTEIVLRQLRAKPETTIMIGDAPMDFLSAKNAGIENTILVTTGQIAKNELLQTSPYVVNSLDEISIR